MLLLFSLNSSAQESNTDLTQFVNPFIGTGGHGHTYPGATMPFGMMQLSPDTRLKGWDGCSGYHYTDQYIYGFSHTHLSGTGVSDYGDFLLMPTNHLVFNNGADGKDGYRSHFSHATEIAHPGFYKVHLDDPDIDVALTTSYRSGVHKYQYAGSKNQYLILDLEHRDKLLKYKINIIDSVTVSGYRFSSAWARDQRLFFYLKLSQPIAKYYLSKRNQQKAQYVTPTKLVMKFKNPQNKPVIVKMGISPVDIAGAKKNLETEIGGKTFAQVKDAAKKTWNKALHKIVVKNKNKDDKVVFYTALYHAMIAPNLYQDVDGRYRGMDMKIHQADFNYYTVFSLWDTFRAEHPLFTIIDQARTTDFIKTFIAKYKEGGIMPIWDLAANYTHCMIGYHGVAVIADAYMKGIRNYNTQLALEAMVHSAMQDGYGLKSYKKYGFIPVEDEGESVSKTLEYAYDDWTIAQMAKAMGKTKLYQKFIQRAQYYKNEFDPQTRFMRGRYENTWYSPFNPYEVNFNYTEANAWQYSFYVPQDINGLINLYGGKKSFEKQLDALFTAKTQTTGREQPDITGLIGQYVQGNEPSHQIVYMYNFVNTPSKTQKYVHQIVSQLYKNSPDGIPGNEDCGQMSAWYIFSALGFYPVTPGSNQYIIGTPHFKQAQIHLENGKTFTVNAPNVSAKNFYIQSATLNGKPYPYTYITQQDIMNGGTLSFVMTDHPTAWGTTNNAVPKTAITQHLIVPVPFIEKGKLAFKDQTQIVLNSIDPQSTIYYKLDDSSFQPYTHPITLHKSTHVTIYAQRGNQKSATYTTNFAKMDPNLSIQLGTKYYTQYGAGGNNALIDGFYGGKDFRSGTWQGYDDHDVIATVTLKHKKYVDSLSIGFLQSQRSWIFLPKSVTVYYSTDGKTFKKLAETKLHNIKQKQPNKIKRMFFPVHKSVKAVKIHAVKAGALPKWHPGYPSNGQAFIFTDEITLYEKE